MLVPARMEPEASNVKGPFYVTDQCILCALPPEKAPDNISCEHDCQGPHTCRFFKQPKTQMDLNAVLDAMWGSCIEAV